MIPFKLQNALASTIAVTGTATPLFDLIDTAAGVEGTFDTELNFVTMSVEGTAGTDDVRILNDNTPTATEGFLLTSGRIYTFAGPSLKKFNLIRTGALNVPVSLQIGFTGSNDDISISTL